MRPKLYQPFQLPVRIRLWIMWGGIAVAVLLIGSQSSEPNPPLGLLLLGLGLAGPGLLAVLALTDAARWDRLIDSESDIPATRKHLSLLALLGLIGAVMVGFALYRLF